MKRQGIPICLYYLFIYRPFSICGISSDVIFSHPFVSVVFSLFFLEKSDKSFISFIDIHQHLFSLTFSCILVVVVLSHLHLFQSL